MISNRAPITQPEDPGFDSHRIAWFWRRTRCWLAALLLTVFATHSTHGFDSDSETRQFLKQHCVKCHGSANQKADRRIDNLSFDLADEETLGQWQDIVDQLNLGDMPPASEPRPDANQLQAVIAALSAKIQVAQSAVTVDQTETVLRRLNRREYLNTIRDLFGFEMSMFDPTIGFPDDETDEGLDVIGTDPEEPIRLALVSGSQEFGTLHLRQSIEKTLAVFDLPDDEPQWQEQTIWLDKGFQPRMTYQNGPYFFKVLPNILHRQFPEQFPIKLVYSNWWPVCQNIKTPQIRVHEVELEGPFYDQWPPVSHRLIFGEQSFEPDQTLEVLQRFATRAFRRPVRPDELKSLMSLVESRRELGESPLEALKAGLIATLCSPGFLYLEDSPVADGDSNSLDGYSIASRMSYFLWSTMPDQTLLNLARDGQLTDLAVVQAQTRRMLRDKKAESFVGDFCDRWLTLYKLGEMPPDNRKFEHYFVGELESAMQRETHLFFKHILDENLDLGNFLDSDFTFINRPLAHHYNLDLKQFEQQWQQQSPNDGFVKFPLDNRHRGGLFGQASVLTVTANGIDTSPVIRGIWVLENILGASTPPPPEGIEPLEPDTRGSVSIRQQLQKHRNVATCAECHKKIDPLGFALESFDAIGGQRSHYVSGKTQLKIDTSGKLPDGKTFTDVSELKTILTERKPQFTRCLTEKMLSYAIGRPLTIRDRPVVDEIVQSLNQDGAGLKNLVLAIVQSKPFLSR